MNELLIIFPITIVYIIIILTIYYTPLNISKFLRTYILADFPLFQISDDDSFHTIEPEISDKKHYRYSLLFIPIGEYKLYIFTLKNKKINFFYLLSLSDIFNEKLLTLKDEIDIDLQNEQTRHLNSSKADKFRFISIMQDTIKTYQASMQTAKLKGTFYFTLIGAAVSVFLGKIIDIQLYFISTNIFTKILILYIVVLFLNFFFLTIQFHSIKNFHKQVYNDYINNTYANNYFAYFYKNMRFAEFYSQKEVSYIKNVEFYLKKILFVLIFLITVIFLYNENIKEEQRVYYDEATIYCKV